MQGDYAAERAAAASPPALLSDAALMEWIAANGPARFSQIAAAFGIQVYAVRRLAQQLQRLRKAGDAVSHRPRLRADNGGRWRVEAGR